MERIYGMRTLQLALLLASCQRTTREPCVGVTDEDVASDVCAGWARLLVESAARCDGGQLHEDPACAEDMYRDACLEHYDGRDAFARDPALDAECLEFAKERLAECREWWTVGDPTHPCNARWVGTIAEGERCGWDDECAPGLTCVGTDGTGSCEPLPEIGEACVPEATCIGNPTCEERCAAGGFCFPTWAGGDERCHAALRAGEPCGEWVATDPSFNPCEWGFFCDGSACVALPGDGDPCGPGGACDPSLVCLSETTTCGPQQPDGSACSHWMECESGCCNPNRCEDPSSCDSGK